jgi:hypothetical protein
MDTKPNSETPCPSCRRVLAVEKGAAFCEECKLYLASIPTRSKRFAWYALSLPERLSRIAVGSAAGVVKGISELLLPEALRQTKMYQVLLQKNLRYLIQEVGAVDGVYAGGAPVLSNYVARKFVGNFMEIAGILTMRASPVWILALVSDLSGGTKAFLREFTDELKREGLLNGETRIESVDQLLDGLQSLSARIADQIDTPPLSVEELRETLTFLRQEAQVFKLVDSVKPEEMHSMLTTMKEVAKRENKTLYEISSAMAMGAVNRMGRSGRSAVTGLRVGRALLDRTILQYYRRALDDIAEQGYYRYLARSSKPYLNATQRHLMWRNVTWTERYFLSRTWSRTT